MSPAGVLHAARTTGRAIDGNGRIGKACGFCSTPLGFPILSRSSVANDARLFDPARSVSFDLARGQVELRDGDPQVLVPAAALSALFEGEGPRAFGRAVGVGAVGRVAARFAANARTAGRGLNVRELMRSASLEMVVELLGGELATMGLGSLRVERWGQALLFVLDPCTLDERADKMLCGLVEGALESVAARPASAIVVDRADSSTRILVASATAVARAKQILAKGSSFVEVITELHGENQGAAAAPREPT